MFADRVLSGMRPTGRMHIGHYHGALKNWIRLQEEYECLFFAADWHALTTHFDNFTKGVINSGDLVYYLSIIVLGIFLTARSVEALKGRP